MTKFKIKGSMCPVCASKIENEIRLNNSIKELHFDFGNRTIMASGENVVIIVQEAVKKYEPSAEAVLDEEELVIETVDLISGNNTSVGESVKKYGHDGCCGCETSGKSNISSKSLDDISLIIGIIFVILSLLPFNKIKHIFAVLAVFTAGYPVIRDGLKVVLRGGGLDERFLMSISSIGAILIGEPIEGAAVMILYRIGEMVTAHAIARANKSLEDLVVSQETHARVVDQNGISRLVDAREIKVGTEIIVNPHEMIPLDSISTKEIVVDNSSFTGESEPIRIKPGEYISAGAVLLYNDAKLTTVKDYEHSSIFRMNKLLERAKASKSKQEKFLTVFAKYYTPVVVLVAIFIAILPFFTDELIKDSLHKSLSFLVTSCPCALVLGVPLSYAVGIGALSSKGILIKGSENIDTLSRLKFFAMDKTGTVTENYLIVEKIHNISSYEYDYIKLLMAIGEKYSKHPIAQSFKIDNVPDPKEYKEIPGIGVDFSYENHSYKIRSAEDLGDIALYENEKLISYFTLVEKIKKDAINAIDELKKLNLNPYILSGDKFDKVNFVANRIGVNKFKAECTPEDKLNPLF